MILCVLDSRNLLFSEPRQAIYELDDFSAEVWRSLERGLTEEEIAKKMMLAGARFREVREAVAASVQKLREIEASDSAPQPRESSCRSD